MKASSKSEYILFTSFWSVILPTKVTILLKISYSVKKMKS
jgi:hypothetical protein